MRLEKELVAKDSFISINYFINFNLFSLYGSGDFMPLFEQKPIYFFNTLTREKEQFEPLKRGSVSLYTCGPTVYNFAHIGNFRCYIFEDLLHRTLLFFGYDLHHVMNITDVDDKTIKGALRENTTLDNYTDRFTKAFFEDLDTLGIKRAKVYPKATDYIPQMIELIEKLLEKKLAYVGSDKSVYYAINQFPNYGCLSHLKLDELEVGASARVASDEYEKDHAADFVLWKAYDKERDGDIYWNSPFGPGRPGWHIECSAMAMSLLGESLDIHCGAIDNMFPHHENEIAQSEGVTGKPFSKYWLHAEHLIVDGKKMSKSLGNFYTLRDLTDKNYTGRQLRYLLLQTHYKTQLNFTLQSLEAARHTLKRLDEFVMRLNRMEGKGNPEKVKELTEKTFDLFASAMADDLNISSALAALFDMVREANTLMDANEIGSQEAKTILSLLERFDEILGVLRFSFDEEIPEELIAALEKRTEARTRKDWKESDRIRDFIQSKGYQIEDSPKGARLKKMEVAHE
ncbi:Cysteinyl-tRNA synthetase [Criblamydia sequanensis CRIB-18]|uniref:Cysteine--tRNA ligase n=2 Tax=Candidatus Criblamydia sequanensis TaxID=340071 RepID=A0A090CY90_9BACT|nr:Cysteinyl-tRNA synthetase [Criblamydia sequanensis CRIB-18]